MSTSTVYPFLLILEISCSGVQYMEGRKLTRLSKGFLVLSYRNPIERKFYPILLTVRYHTICMDPHQSSLCGLRRSQFNELGRRTGSSESSCVIRRPSSWYDCGRGRNENHRTEGRSYKKRSNEPLPHSYPHFGT